MSETPDQAATRRRWITLAELVAVAGVVIGALTLWNSWAERRSAETERSQTAQEAAKKSRFTLRGTAAADGGAVTLTRDEDHTVDDVRVAFPTPLALPVRDAVAETIDRDWFAPAILTLTDGGADEQTGRLPVLVRYTYVDADGRHPASGLYDVVWAIHGRLGRGRVLEITDFRLRQQGGSQQQLDTRWDREKPRG